MLLTNTDIQADAQAVAHRVANWLLELSSLSSQRFSICLSGGSTPKLLYQTLAQSPYKENFQWDKVHVFWGDERFVPKDSDLSNFHMTNDALLSKVPIPSKNIHAVKTELADPHQAASDYETTLKTYYDSDKLDSRRQLFDVTLLGLGPDGHTASLFPGSPVLQERTKWVSAVIGAKPEVRITLTYPTLESSRHVAFLVTGKEKEHILKEVQNHIGDLPAAKLKPQGELHWFVDQAAAY